MHDANSDEAKAYEAPPAPPNFEDILKHHHPLEDKTNGNQWYPSGDRGGRKRHIGNEGRHHHHRYTHVSPEEGGNLENNGWVPDKTRYNVGQAYEPHIHGKLPSQRYYETY